VTLHDEMSKTMPSSAQGQTTGRSRGDARAPVETPAHGDVAGVPPRPTQRTADEALVHRILAGDEDAAELLMRRHNQLLFRVARSIVRDSAEAEDVLQDAYVSAFSALGRFEGRSSLATWLARIVANKARSRVQRQRRNVPLAVHADLDGNVANDDSVKAAGWLGDVRRGPEEAAGDGELRAMLAEAVDRLPEPLRTVFVLRCAEGMNAAETAECLDVSAEVVRVRLHRARAALRADIDRSLDQEARQLFAFGLDRCDRIVARVLDRLREDLSFEER